MSIKTGRKWSWFCLAESEADFVGWALVSSDGRRSLILRPQNYTTFYHEACASCHTEALNILIDLPNRAISYDISEDVVQISFIISSKYCYLVAVQRACDAITSRQKAIWLHPIPCQSFRSQVKDFDWIKCGYSWITTKCVDFFFHHTSCMSGPRCIERRGRLPGVIYYVIDSAFFQE